MPRHETRNVTGIRGTGAVDANEVWRVFECFSPVEQSHMCTGTTILIKLSRSYAPEVSDAHA